jgi:hypothetical protein
LITCPRRLTSLCKKDYETEEEARAQERLGWMDGWMDEWMNE